MDTSTREIQRSYRLSHTLLFLLIFSSIYLFSGCFMNYNIADNGEVTTKSGDAEVIIPKDMKINSVDGKETWAIRSINIPLGVHTIEYSNYEVDRSEFINYRDGLISQGYKYNAQKDEFVKVDENGRMVVLRGISGSQYPKWVKKRPVEFNFQTNSVYGLRSGKLYLLSNRDIRNESQKGMYIGLLAGMIGGLVIAGINASDEQEEIQKKTGEWVEQKIKWSTMFYITVAGTGLGYGLGYLYRYWDF